MPWLFNLLYLCVLILISPWLVYKAATTGKYRRGMAAKFLGSADHPLLSKTWPGPTVWLHGVSVGEIHLLRHVVAACQKRHPRWRLVVSTTTDTGFDEAQKIFADLPVIWWPLDFSWAVNRTLDRVRPDLVVLGESELWPNFLRAANGRDIPVAVINARMSPRSAARFEKLRFLTRGVFARVSLFAAQTEEYAARYRRLGAKNVIMTGSIKYDGAASDRDNPRTRELAKLFSLSPSAKQSNPLAPLSPRYSGGRGAGGEGGCATRSPGATPLTPGPSPPGVPGGEGDRKIWVAGSTQSPEEELCLTIFTKARAQHPTLRLILVPRHKERFDDVARLLERSGQPFVRRSQLTEPTDAPIVLVDTIGELGALWGLADVAFVGGSLDGQRGGQNMIEPAAYGAAVVFGPHTWNFKETVARLLEHRAAVEVADAQTLETTILRLLADPHERQCLGDVAREFVRSQQGATERTLDALDSLLRSAMVHERAA